MEDAVEPTSESAVSSVVGTVLMLAITVAVFGGFAIFTLDYVQAEGHAPRADLSMVQGSGSLYLQHRGGESFGARDGTLYVNVGGTEVSLPLADTAFDGLGTSWDVGDLICVQGDAAGCLYASTDDIRGAFLVDERALLAAAGERGVVSGVPANPDLTVSLVSSSPAGPITDDEVTWTVRIANGGTASTAAVPLLVRIAVDGIEVATATAPGPLSIGDDVDVTSTPAWTATLGAHTLDLTVDPLSAVAESDDANNAVSVPFEVAAGTADPGQPFVDTNGDGLYTPGTDTTIATSDVQDGSYDAGSGSLVLPPSIGDISSDSVSFTAGGDIVIGVELTSANGPMSLTAGGDLVFDDAALTALQNNDDLTLTVGGRIDAAELIVSVNGDLRITAAGPIDFAGASLTVTSNNNVMQVTGQSIDLTDATLSNAGNTGNTIAITATAGAIAASSVEAHSTGSQTWKASGGGIDLDETILDAATQTLTACLASDTADGLSLSGTLAITDSNSKLDAQRGSSCTQDANLDAYVTPWPTSASDAPRSKLE